MRWRGSLGGSQLWIVLLVISVHTIVFAQLQVLSSVVLFDIQARNAWFYSLESRTSHWQWLLLGYQVGGYKNCSLFLTFSHSFSFYLLLLINCLFKALPDVHHALTAEIYNLILVYNLLLPPLYIILPHIHCDRSRYYHTTTTNSHFYKLFDSNTSVRCLLPHHQYIHCIQF